MAKRKILICGILPPPTFGHSMMYQMLMNSRFVEEFDVIFLDMHFWTYGKHKKVTVEKLVKLARYYFRFIWLILTKRPDFILYNISFYKMPFLKDILFCFTAKLLRCRYVIHDMGKYLAELYDSSSWMMKRIVRLYLRWATASIIQGEGVRSVYDGFMDQRRIWVVPGCVEDSGGWNVPVWHRNGKINILYFSFLSEEKGVYTAFLTVPKVLERNSDVSFIFGGPVESDKVRNKLDALMDRFPENMKYMGYVEGAIKRTECFRNADIFIFPTQRECFGLVLLHAMAEKLPIVASVEGCIPEILRDGENGFLVHKSDDEQLAQRILQLAVAPQLRKVMGEANRQRFLTVYSHQEYGRKMIESFKGIDRLPSSSKFS